jgi:hypothetical protein
MLAWGLFTNQTYNLPAGTLPEERFYGVTEVAVPPGRRITYIGASQRMIYGVLDDGKLILFPSFPIEGCIRFIDKL